MFIIIKRGVNAAFCYMPHRNDGTPESSAHRRNTLITSTVQSSEAPEDTARSNNLSASTCGLEVLASSVTAATPCSTT